MTDSKELQEKFGDILQVFSKIEDIVNAGGNTIIEFLQIVVIGDESAGKSSLLQSIFSLQFPQGLEVKPLRPTKIISEVHR